MATAYTNSYICTPCAEKQGCTWPKVHAATFHTGECNYCHKDVSVCHTTDWDWPNKDVSSQREL